MRTLIVVATLVASASAVQAAEEHSFWWRTKAEAACIADVIRFCKSAMPDEDKVKDCMKDKKQLVSARCASYYPGGENAE